MTASIIAVVFMLGFLWVAFQRERARHELERTKRQLAKANTRLKHYEPILDYVLRKFSLHVADPYIVRPGFEEKRCFHCFYPEPEGHDRECPWVILHPFVEAAYNPSERPQNAPQPQHVASVLPAKPPARKPAN